MSDRLTGLVLPKKKNGIEEKWVLKNISFNLKKGHCLGIIGRNGSGKSTLLQIICETLQPSCGEVIIDGKISALLELGSGFDPEFTGKENIFLLSELYGLSKNEIVAKYSSILQFSEIGEYIDQPVKHYSSGMYVRLAFALAIHVMPDILVVDEALSVGDELFQRKCLSRILELKRNSCSILFVSHSTKTILELCDTALMLDQGEMLMIDEPKKVVSNYHRLLHTKAEKFDKIRERIKSDDDFVNMPMIKIDDRKNGRKDLDSNLASPFYDTSIEIDSIFSYVSNGASIKSIQLKTIEGMRVNSLLSRKYYVFSYEIEFNESYKQVKAAMLIKTLTGFELGGGATKNKDIKISEKQSKIKMLVEFKFNCLLAPGIYFFNAGVDGLVNGVRVYLDRKIDCYAFRVMPFDSSDQTAVVDFLVEPGFKYL